MYGAAAGDGATEWYDALGNLDPATAAATGASLPLVYDPGGAGAYEVLLVRRNGHGVDSGNRTVVPVVVNGSGNEGFDPVGPVTGLRAVSSRPRGCGQRVGGCCGCIGGGWGEAQERPETKGARDE